MPLLSGLWRKSIEVSSSTFFDAKIEISHDSLVLNPVSLFKKNPISKVYFNTIPESHYLQFGICFCLYQFPFKLLHSSQNSLYFWKKQTHQSRSTTQPTYQSRSQTPRFSVMRYFSSRLFRSRSATARRLAQKKQAGRNVLHGKPF